MAIKSNLKVLIARKSQQEERRVTYADISQATGLSTNTITKLANNQSQMVGINTLDKLCAYFDVGVGDLLVYVPDPAVSPDGREPEAAAEPA